jgi:tetratricopeptide (TPR) repeat protein
MKRRERRGPAASVLVFSCLLLACTAARSGAGELPRDRDGWIQVRSANFLLWSDAGERRTRELAAELEQLRGALGQLDPRLALAAPRPTYLYVFKNRFALAPYTMLYHGKRAEVAGYFAPRALANYMVIDGDARGDAEHIVYHEYLHDILHNNYSHLPLWLDERLAEYFSTFHVAEGEVRIGLPAEEHIRWLRQNPPIPLPQLFAIDQQSPDYNEGVRQGVFYAESWALTHYLMLGNPARRPQLAQLAKLLEAGVPQPEAFSRAFGGDYAGLEQELRVYVSRKVFSYEHTPVRSPAELAVTVTRLAPADVLYRLGDLLLNASKEQLPAAAEHFRAALAAAPDHALATAGLGEVDELEGRLGEAQRRYEKAVELAAPALPAQALEPRDAALVHLLLGRNLLSQAQPGSRGPAGEHQAQLTRAAAELARATELAPALGEAWLDLGRARLGVEPPPAGTVAALLEAQRLLPTHTEVTLNLALAYAETGERRQAEAQIERARLAGAAPEDLARLRDALLVADYNRAIASASAGDLAGAAELLRQVVAATHDGGFRHRAEETLGRVRDAASRQSAIAAFNRAVDLANHGETRKAIAELEALLAGTPGIAGAAAAPGTPPGSAAPGTPAPAMPNARAAAGATPAEPVPPPADVASRASELLADLQHRLKTRG